MLVTAGPSVGLFDGSNPSESRISAHRSRRTDYAVLADSYRAFLAYLRRVGLPPSPHSRLEYYRLFVDAWINAPEVGILWPLRRTAIELALITREVTEMTRLASVAPAQPGHELRERLKRLREGRVLGEDESGSPSREAQFELALYSRSRIAGLPVQMGRPDLLVRVGKQTLAIEAKRPGSAPRLEEALREASRVMSDHPGPRLVAIQIDRLVRAPWGWLDAEDGPELAQKSHQILEKFVARTGHLVIKRCVDKGVTAVAFFLSSPGWTRQTGEPTTFDVTYYHAVGDRHSREFECVAEWASRTALPE